MKFLYAAIKAFIVEVLVFYIHNIYSTIRFIINFVLLLKEIIRTLHLKFEIFILEFMPTAHTAIFVVIPRCILACILAFIFYFIIVYFFFFKKNLRAFALKIRKLMYNAVLSAVNIYRNITLKILKQIRRYKSKRTRYVVAGMLGIILSQLIVMIIDIILDVINSL